MSDQEQPATAYDAWIALLRSQRDALDAAILALERLAATTAGAPIGTPPLGDDPRGKS